MVHDRRAPHQPRVGSAGHRVAAFLGAEHAGLLLSAPDEQHALGSVETGQVLVRHVVFALSGPKVDEIDTLIGYEPVDVGYEALRDRVHQRGRHEREPAVALEEPDHPELVLKPRLVDVEVHPVDALHLEAHMVFENIGHSAG